MIRADGNHKFVRLTFQFDAYMMPRKTGSYRTDDRTEYKELVVPAPLLIQSNRQGFSYANPADRNPPPDAEYIIITIFEGKTETSSDNNV